MRVFPKRDLSLLIQVVAPESQMSRDGADKEFTGGRRLTERAFRSGARKPEGGG